MATLIKTTGIVIHEMPIKEQDKRIIIFSKDYGKMVVFANGAKRIKSPLLAGSQLFVFGEFQLYEGRNSYTLKQVDIEESFYALRQDLLSLYHGMYLLEIIGSVIQEMDANKDLLRLLYISLMAIKNKTVSPAIAKTVFMFRALNYLGYAPDLNECLVCHDKDGRYELSSRGGLICSKCNKNQKTLTKEGLFVLRYIQGTPFTKLFHFQIDKELHEMVDEQVTQYFGYFISDDYKSLKFIAMLDT